MRALESLERDHRLLQGLSEALEVYVGALEAGQPLRAGDLTALVEAFRVVADYLHFEKVEEVLVPLLVRNGFDLGLLDGRDEHSRVRYSIEVLHQSAERELNWNLDERERIARVARHLVEEQRRISARQAVELFPEIVTRLDPSALGQLTEQLCQFDEVSAARSAGPDIAALTRGVLARYATRLHARSGGTPQRALPAQAALPPALQPSRDLPPAREIAR